MRAFRTDFVRSSLDRLAEMETLLGRLATAPADPESVRALLGHFHGLSGAGGTYGFWGVTTLGQDGEASCRTVLSGSGSAVPADLAFWSDLVTSLRSELSLDPAPEASAALRVSAAGPPIDLLMVGGEEEDRDLLKQFAERDGMALRCAGSAEEAAQELNRRIPDGAIVNVDLPDGNGFAVVELLRGLPGGETPAVLIVSGAGAFADRVDALHCGADGFFLRPLDGEAVMRRLEFLFRRARVEPSRILSVEDDPVQANYLTAVLESAGYEVRICGEPEHFYGDIAGFRPDMVLMDIQLPGASGYDLVRSLRQEETQATMPVVFLTTQSEMSSRIEAARAGGDDHLVKPVSPSLLLSTVASRIERSRFLRSLLERDGLTRLLSHTAFLERARVAVARQQRHPDWNCAFVMLDIDRFKAVNDLHGHPAGDRVLAALAALLRRRLRLSDTIGRMGGDEFALLLEEFNEEQALRLMQRLLQEFSAIEHAGAGDQSFRTTFSGGVAMLLAPRSDLKSWHQAADAALYAAKTEGRNRIVAVSEGGG